jgi:hypothetical protein
MRDEKEDRKEFYFKVAALVGTEPEKGKSIDETPTATKWQYGFSSYPQSQAVIICTHSLRYAEHWKIGHQEKTLEDGPDGTKLFVGWEVVSNWSDGANGEWWKAVDQILLTDHAAVHIKSDYDRGCDWTVNFYWVESKDYQFGK